MSPVNFEHPRVRRGNDRPVRPERRYVLYWMQTCRRFRCNHAFVLAAQWAETLHKPLVVYEGLKLYYPWSNARLHAFALQGMQDNAAAARELGVNYWPFVETPEQPGRGLLQRLAQQACLIVTDDYPAYIVPAHNAALARSADTAVVLVDGNGIVPLRQLGPAPAAAAHLRPRLHRHFVAAWKERVPQYPELRTAVRAAVEPPFERWDPQQDILTFVRQLPIDQTVVPITATPGGAAAGRRRLEQFVRHKLPRYAAERNHPDDPDHGAASGLSPYLRWGHLGIQEVVEAVLGPEWTPEAIDPRSAGRREGFFGDDPNVNAFLDEALVWRDVGYVWHYFRQPALGSRPQGTVSWHRADSPPHFNYRSYDFSPLPGDPLADTLPAWAWSTLREHVRDRRSHLYRLEEWEAAATHDPLWNAAQRELVLAGRIHNYLRMLWGKKVLEWSADPTEAYLTLEHLNNKYALDGRDPNSYTGILWCFGLFDRPWAPVRPVFGSIRYMSSDSTARKYKLDNYFDYIRRLEGTHPPPLDAVQGPAGRVRGLFDDPAN